MFTYFYWNEVPLDWKELKNTTARALDITLGAVTSLFFWF